MQRLSRVDRTARQKLELQIFLLYLLGVCSRRHPVMTSGCLFTVARQHYFKCECKCCGALSCFIQKCISLRLFSGKGLLFPKICTFEFLLHRGIPIVNWFFPRRSMWPIDPIKGWFQLLTSTHHWTRAWINTEIMQIELLWNKPLR